MYSFIARHIRWLARMRFVQDVLTLQTGTLVYTGVTFVSSIVFARVLGIETYGIYAVLLSFIGTLTLITNLGQGSSLLIFLSEEIGKKNMTGMATVLKNYLQVSIWNTVLLLILFFVTPELLEWLYGRTDIAMFARILLVYYMVDMWNSMTLVILQALREFRTKVIVEQAANISFLIAAIVGLYLGFGIGGIVVAQLATSVVFLLVSMVILTMLARAKRIPTAVDVLHIPLQKTFPYFGQGLLFSIEKNIGNFFPQGLFFFLSLVASPSTVGLARIATQIANVPRSILLPSIGDVSAVVLTKMRGEGVQAMRMQCVRVIKHAVALYAAFVFGSLIAVPILLPILYGDAYAAAVPLTLWLLLASLPIALCIVNSPVIRLFRKSQYSIAQALLSWVLIATTMWFGVRIVSPEKAFVIAFAIAQLMPITITAYMFTVLLPRSTSERPAS